MSKYIDLDQVEFLKVDGNKEFNHGVDCCINKLMKQECVQVIPLDKVKQARKEIEDNLFVAYGEYDNPQSYYTVVEVKDVFKILDNLIAESEV